MNRMKKWLGNLGVLLALAAGLAAWIFMPWYGVLALAVLVSLWLFLTRSGGSRSPPRSRHRQPAARWVIVGDRDRIARGRRAGAMLAMARLQATLNRTGSEPRDHFCARLAAEQIRDHARPVPLISSLPSSPRR